MHIDAFPYTMAYLGSHISLNNAVSESEALVAKGAESDLGQYSQMTKEQFFKPKSAYEKLITEHQQKLSDYIKNPDVYDNKGLLKNVSLEIREKIISGRINELQSKINKQQGELNKILKTLKSFK